MTNFIITKKRREFIFVTIIFFSPEETVLNLEIGMENGPLSLEHLRQVMMVTLSVRNPNTNVLVWN